MRDLFSNPYPFPDLTLCIRIVSYFQTRIRIQSYFENRIQIRSHLENRNRIRPKHPDADPTYIMKPVSLSEFGFILKTKSGSDLILKIGSKSDLVLKLGSDQNTRICSHGGFPSQQLCWPLSLA